MLQIGITGGIGAGKSLICRAFYNLGIPVYDADTHAKRLMISNRDLIKAIKDAFGKNAYLENGSLNRSYLSQEVFSNASKKKTIESLVHPAVGRDYLTWVNKQKTGYIIKEAALMFESNSYKELDTIINVTAPTELRVERVLSRDPYRSQQSILSIIEQQYSDEQRESLSNFTIVNDGKTMVLPLILMLHKKFIQGEVN